MENKYTYHNGVILRDGKVFSAQKAVNMLNLYANELELQRGKDSLLEQLDEMNKSEKK